MAETKKVEFLLAYEDQWWDTEVMDIPATAEDDTEIMTWFNKEIMTLAAYRKVVMGAIYDHDPDEGRD